LTVSRSAKKIECFKRLQDLLGTASISALF
jgi:hypothetical protein